MKTLKLAITALSVLILVEAADSQTVGIGTTKGGATAQVTAAISKVVTIKGQLKMRPQPMGGTQQYIPIVNAGELDFGVSNLPQYWMAKTGTGMAKRKYDNLILVAKMLTFRTGLLVANKSNIHKVTDFRGKRAPHGFKAAPLFHFLFSAYLANGGLSYDDVTKVPVVALRQHWNLFKQGKIDGVVAAIGSAAVKDMNASIKGGVRYVSLEDSSEAVKRTLAVYPKSKLRQVKPNPKLTGVLSPVNVLHFDYTLWTHKGQKDETVYKVVKAMYESEQTLRATSPLWRTHASKTMAKQQGTPYHPGAIKFYREVGIWKQ